MTVFVIAFYIMMLVKLDSLRNLVHTSKIHFETLRLWDYQVCKVFRFTRSVNLN